MSDPLLCKGKPKGFEEERIVSADPERNLATGVIAQALQDIGILHRAMVRQKIPSTLCRAHRESIKYNINHYRESYFIGWDAVRFCVADSHKDVRELWCSVIDIPPHYLRNWLMRKHYNLYQDALLSILF